MGHVETYGVKKLEVWDAEHAGAGPSLTSPDFLTVLQHVQLCGAANTTFPQSAR